MNRAYIPLYKPVITQEMVTAAEDALKNERLILGESVHKFEQEFARFCGVKHAVATNSGTSALFLSLLAIGMRKGYEAVTTTMSFIATANVVLHTNAKPVLCDVNNYGNIDPASIKKAIRKKTKAIMPVHLHGYPAEMKEINEIAEKKNIMIIEDACQAHGATYNGKMVGSIGDIGCFSFNPMKNMTVGGDGGIITTNNSDIAKAVAELVDCGRKSPYHCDHSRIGYTARMNTINAAIGRVQLKYLNEWQRDREFLVKEYSRGIQDIKEIRIPQVTNNIKPGYNKFVILTKKQKKLMDYLLNNNIATDAHFSIPIHLQPVYKKLFKYKKGDYPAAERYAKTTLSLPLYPYMKLADIDYICQKINQFFNKK